MSQQILVKHINCHIQRENSVTFLDFRVSQGKCSNILQVRWKSLWCIHKELSHKSIGERILKIGPLLPNLLSNIKWLSLLETV